MIFSDTLPVEGETTPVVSLFYHGVLFFVNKSLTVLNQLFNKASTN